MASVEKFGGLVRSTSFGRKRVALSSDVGMAFANDVNCVIPSTPVKRRCFDYPNVDVKKSALEDLPQEILIRIICGVDHDDLKRLFFVSKSIRAAALLAKQSHFAYSTPRKNSTLKNVEDFGEFFNEVEVEAPNAPKQSRIRRSRLNAKTLADISVSLFASENDNGSDCWPRRNLFHEARVEN